MPIIRIMNWNIEQLSWNKIRIPGMATAIARTIVSQNIDIVVLLEVRSTNVQNMMGYLSAALNLTAQQFGGQVDDYTAWFLSYKTGGEHYGFIIKNLNQIRPLQLTANPQANNRPDGNPNNPLRNLDENAWRTWPNWGAAAYPISNPKPRMPLTDLYATNPPRGRQQARLGGQPLQGGRGYALGRGYRLPCLAIFDIHINNRNYLIPIITCHFAAVRGGRNMLGQSQVQDYHLLHIAQLFSSVDPANPQAPRQSGYIDVNGIGTNIQDIIITGDFNLDFLQNETLANAVQPIEWTNHSAYMSLTPTTQGGGSGAPPGNPGNPGPLPIVPFQPPFGVGPNRRTVREQSLKAAITLQGTILRRYVHNQPPANVGVLRGAAFDNFFYGGTCTTNSPNPLQPGADSGIVIDLPSNIVNHNPGAREQIDVRQIVNHYLPTRTKHVHRAPNLLVPNRQLNPGDRLIGARLVSDHLPVILDFFCP
jgi:hypothetical protein